MCVRVHVCVRARVLHASHQQQGSGDEAVVVANLTWWTTRDAGHPVCAPIVRIATLT